MENPKRKKLSQPIPELKQYREEIDRIDDQMRSLLEERFRLVREIGATKIQAGGAVYDQRRELDILARIQEESDPHYASHISAIWETILRNTRSLQYKDFQEHKIFERLVREVQDAPVKRPPCKQLAFMGDSGSSLVPQIRELYPEANPVPCASFRSAFQKLNEEHVDAILVPLEDSVVGSVREVYYLLAEYGAYIQETIVRELPYQLLVRQGMTIGGIHSVVAHPRVLQACSGFIRKMEWTQIEEQSSQAAAQLTAQHVDGPIAAIATAYEAQTYGLSVLPTSLPLKQTQEIRYALIGRMLTRLPEARYAYVSMFLPNQPSTLATVTGVLADSGINIRKLRTHPVEGAPWNQQILIELDIRAGQYPTWLQAMSMLSIETRDFRLLGYFPERALDCKVGDSAR